MIVHVKTRQGSSKAYLVPGDDFASKTLFSHIVHQPMLLDTPENVLWLTRLTTIHGSNLFIQREVPA